MKPILLTILLATLCLLAATAGAQTIKGLGYNTTNGHVVYNATNNSGTQLTLVFTNANGARLPFLAVGNIEYTTNAITFYGTNSGFAFGAGASAAQLRNNLGLPLAALTNTSLTNFLTAIGLGWSALTNTNSATALLGYDPSNGNIVYSEEPFSSQFVFTNVSGVKSKLFATINMSLGTNSITFYGTNSGFEFSAGATSAQIRNNLNIPLPALTNTSNVTMMRALADSTNTNAPFSGSVSVVGTNNTNTLVFTNGILLEITTP